MSGKYTQGEWKQQGAGSSRKIKCFGRTVATIISTSAGSNEEKYANALLIAAAPDMLNALEAMKEYTQDCVHTITEREQAAKKVNAALAKATGAK